MASEMDAEVEQEYFRQGEKNLIMGVTMGLKVKVWMMVTTLAVMAITLKALLTCVNWIKMR